MTTYIAFTYTKDVDWSDPEHAAEMADYRRFGVENEANIRGGARALSHEYRDHRPGGGARGGEIVTTDGPYAETKEALTAYYLIEAADLDEAIAIAAQIPAAWNGAVEVRPVIPVSRLGVNASGPAGRGGPRRGSPAPRHPGPDHRRLVSSPRTRCRRRPSRPSRDWPRHRHPGPAAGLADRHRPGGWRSTSSAGSAPGAARNGKERDSDGPHPPRPSRTTSVLDDDLLRLIFTCCHPASPRTPGRARPADALPALRGADRRRAADQRSGHGQAADPDPAEDHRGRHPLPGAGRRRAAGAAGQRSAAWCTPLHRRARADRRATWCSTSTFAPKALRLARLLHGCCPTRPCRPRCSR